MYIDMVLGIYKNHRVCNIYLCLYIHWSSIATRHVGRYVQCAVWQLSHQCMGA